MRKIFALLSFLLIAGLIGCIDTTYHGTIVAARNTAMPISGWVPVPNGWPRPTGSAQLKANNVAIATATVSPTASPQVMGGYDWYPINFGNVVVPDARWTQLVNGKYQTNLGALITSYNGGSSFSYYFRWFSNVDAANCFANRIAENNSIESASSLCAGLPVATITTQ